jgi:tRNA dimethylallyltransferase
MGPTAAGKTRLALLLHEHLPVDIVSVDASQVYRGMDIGTAKPSREELARAPHRLIDIRDPAQAYSVAEFCVDALREMDDIVRRGRIPLLVGGTMFYFRALEQGLSDLPSADPEVRVRLAQEAAQVGWPAMHARLALRDARTAERLSPNDSQRIQRALEIIELTGETPSSLTQTPPPPPPYRFLRVALIPSDRAVLHARIRDRFQAMLEQGLVGEVEALYRRSDLSPELPSVRTVGYRHVWKYLTGGLTYNEMAENSVIATRQLAKRQLTWLRRFSDLNVYDSTEAMERLCLKHLRESVAIRG